MCHTDVISVPHRGDMCATQIDSRVTPLVSNNGDSYVVRLTSNIDSRVAFMLKQW